MAMAGGRGTRMAVVMMLLLLLLLLLVLSSNCGVRQRHSRFAVPHQAIRAAHRLRRALVVLVLVVVTDVTPGLIADMRMAM